MFSLQSSLQTFKGYICSFFQNKPVQGINEEIEEIHCITDEGKMAKNEWENNYSEFYTVYVKNSDNSFPILLINLFKERYIGSVKSYKYLNKLIW